MGEKSNLTPIFRNETDIMCITPKLLAIGRIGTQRHRPNGLDYREEADSTQNKTGKKKKMVAPGGFEPPSAGPEPAMLGRYTTELFRVGRDCSDRFSSFRFC